MCKSLMYHLRLHNCVFVRVPYVTMIRYLVCLCICLILRRAQGFSTETCTYRIILCYSCLMPALTERAQRDTFSISVSCPLSAFLLICVTHTHIYREQGSHMTFLCTWITSLLIHCLWQPLLTDRILLVFLAVSACGWARGLSCASSLGLNSCTTTLTTRSIQLCLSPCCQLE